jgi:hypothetical protein
MCFRELRTKEHRGLRIAKFDDEIRCQKLRKKSVGNNYKKKRKAKYGSAKVETNCP